MGRGDSAASKLPWLVSLIVAGVAAVGFVSAGALLRQARTPPHVPRLPFVAEAINVLGEAGLSMFTPLNADAQEAAAVAATGGRLTDFGYGADHMRPRLIAFMDEVRTSGNVTAVGRQVLGQHVQRILAARLQSTAVHSDAARAAAIAGQRIQRPVVVLGWPRSGTTAFHRLLAALPVFRGLKYYESQYPSGVPGSNVTAGMYAAGGAADPREAIVSRELAMRDFMGFTITKTAHKVDSDASEECNYLLDHSIFILASFLVYAPQTFRMSLPDVPDTTYPLLLREMKTIQWLAPMQEPQRRWLLKAPIHTGYIDRVLGIYPDASMVWMYRDPARALASLCSLTAVLWQLTTHPSPEQGAMIGQYVYPLIRQWARQGVDQYNRLPEDVRARVVFVSYNDFVGASVDEACRVARRLGEPCERGSDAYAALEAHQLEYPRNKFGAHKYSLSDYGLSEVEVRRDMEWYTLWWQQERAKQA